MKSDQKTATGRAASEDTVDPVPASTDAARPFSTCDDCGRVVRVGDHPFCPHGRSLQKSGFKEFEDERLPYVNGKPQVVTGYHSHVRQVKEAGLEFRKPPQSNITEL